jgi:hypothetical protein
MRKLPALARFDLVDSALVVLQEDAGAAGLIGQRQALAIARQPGVFLDKAVLAFVQKQRQPPDLAVVHADLALDPAAFTAAFALERIHEKFLLAMPRDGGMHRLQLSGRED